MVHKNSKFMQWGRALNRASMGKNPVFNRAVSVSGIGANPISNARKIANIARMLNVEKKFKDISVTNSNVYSANPNIKLLNDIDQGDTTSTRDGNQAKVLSLLVKFSVTPAIAHNVAVGSAAPPFPLVYRVMLIHYPMSSCEAAPTLADLLADPTTDPTASPLNLDNTRNFRVLRDKTYVINPNFSNLATTDTATYYFPPKTRHHEFYIKFNKGKKVRYDGTGGGAADVKSGAIFLVVLTESGAATSKGLTMDGWSRVRYVDN